MAAFMLPMFGSDESDVVEDAADGPEPEEVPIAPLPEPEDISEALSEITVTGPLTEGTEESEIFTAENADRDSNGRLEPLTINANGGDDTLNLILQPDPALAFGGDALEDSTISGGAGDDTIEIRSWFSDISGGDGNDTIDVAGILGNTVSGGAGDDEITAVATQSGDGTFVEGDSGDDTIDARGLNNGAVNGGDGDDTIFVQGRNFGGTGYGLFVNGGAGDDTLVYEISTEGPDNRYDSSPFSVRGGEGDDTYRFIFNEGNLFLTESEVPEGAERITMGTLYTIEDFVPGTDTLEFEASTNNAAYEISGLRLEEDVTAGETQVIVSYTSETEIDRDVVIRVNATGVDIDDLVLPDGLAIEEVA